MKKHSTSNIQRRASKQANSTGTSQRIFNAKAQCGEAAAKANQFQAGVLPNGIGGGMIGRGIKQIPLPIIPLPLRFALENLLRRRRGSTKIFPERGLSQAAADTIADHDAMLKTASRARAGCELGQLALRFGGGFAASCLGVEFRLNRSGLISLERSALKVEGS